MKELIKELLALNKELALVQADIDEVKAKIESKLDGQNYKDEDITITYKKGATRTSLDLKSVEAKEPELYKDLFERFAKTTVCKDSVSYSIKK